LFISLLVRPLPVTHCTCRGLLWADHTRWHTHAR